MVLTCPRQWGHILVDNFIASALERVNNPWAITLQMKIFSLNGRSVCQSLVHLFFHSTLGSLSCQMVLIFPIPIEVEEREGMQFGWEWQI